MKTAIAWHYRTTISSRQNEASPRASLRNASQKGGQELFTSYLNTHVKTRVLTCIDIRLIYLALKTWFKRQEYSKLSSL